MTINTTDSSTCDYTTAYNKTVIKQGGSDSLSRGSDPKNMKGKWNASPNLHLLRWAKFFRIDDTGPFPTPSNSLSIATYPLVNLLTIT